MKENYCDGLGACLGDCPQGVLHVTTLEVDAYDEPGVLGYLQQTAPERVEQHVTHLREHGIESSYTPAAKPQRVDIPLCPSVRNACMGPGTGDEGRAGGRTGAVGAAPVACAASSSAGAGALLSGGRSHADRRLRPVRQPQYARRLHTRLCNCGGAARSWTMPRLTSAR